MAMISTGLGSITLSMGATGASGNGRREAEHALEQQMELVGVGAGQQTRAGQRDWVALMDQHRHWQRSRSHYSLFLVILGRCNAGAGAGGCGSQHDCFLINYFSIFYHTSMVHVCGMCGMCCMYSLCGMAPYWGVSCRHRMCDEWYCFLQASHLALYSYL
jgi:hypothetical protein